MTQPYRVQVSAEARRSKHRLSVKVSAAIVEFITGPLADNPMRPSKPPTGELPGYRSARRGDYRAIVRIVESDHTVMVSRIDHRANVYRPR